jgi:hypothetical protein
MVRSDHQFVAFTRGLGGSVIHKRQLSGGCFPAVAFRWQFSGGCFPVAEFGNAPIMSGDEQI